MLAPGAAEPSEPERHDQTPTKQRAAGRHSCRLPYLYLGVKATPPNREDGGVHRVPSKSAGKAGALSLGATREMLQRAWPPPLLSPLARGSCPSPTLTGPWGEPLPAVQRQALFCRLKYPEKGMPKGTLEMLHLGRGLCGEFWVEEGARALGNQPRIAAGHPAYLNVHWEHSAVTPVVSFR